MQSESKSILTDWLALQPVCGASRTSLDRTKGVLPSQAQVGQIGGQIESIVTQQEHYLSKLGVSAARPGNAWSGCTLWTNDALSLCLCI